MSHALEAGGPFERQAATPTLTWSILMECDFSVRAMRQTRYCCDRMILNGGYAPSDRESGLGVIPIESARGEISVMRTAQGGSVDYDEMSEPRRWTWTGSFFPCVRAWQWAARNWVPG